MGIPNKLSPLTGGGSILPSGYLAAEFLENEGNVYLTLPCVSKAGDDISWTFDVQYTQFTTGKQAEGKNGTPYFFCGVTGSEWYWGVNSSILYTGVEADYAWHKFKLSYSKEFTGLEIDDSVFTASYVSENVVLPEALRLWRSYGGQSPCYNRKKQVTVQLNKKTIYELIPCIDLLGKAAFFDKVSQTTFYGSNGALIVGMTPAQARQLSRLPVTAGSTLKVSLPWEAQWDIGVQSALDIAATKGWTITVQYRDPEIATTNIPIRFLENSELGWIDTGLKAHGDTAVECEFVPTQYNFVNIYYAAGTYNTIPSFFGSLDYNKAYGRRFTFGYGQNKLIRFDGQGGMPGYSSTLGVKYKTKQDGGDFYINGELIYNVPVEEFESTTNIGLFGHSWNTSQGVKNLQMYRTKISRAGVKQGDYIPCITQTGVPCFYDRVSKGSFSFNPFTEGAILIAGMTISQAWQLSKLPVVETGTLTVSLPWEAQWDTGVQSALSIAAGRGWIITVQYRDPEITTTNIPISFLESTGEQYINIPIVCGYDAEIEMTATVLQQTFANTPGLFSNEGLSGFSSANRISLLFYANHNVRADFGESSSTEYFPELIIGSTRKYKLNKNGLYIDGTLRISLTTSEFSGTTTRFFARKWTPISARFYNANIKTSTQKAVFVPAIDTQGIPCIVDKATKQPIYNSGTGAFTAGFDTIEPARKLATLPDVTAVTDETKKSLTASLPWEAQLVITGVPAAVQVAVDRGWKITAQYRDAEANNAYYNKYAACTSRDEVLAVNANYLTDLTADGEWVYPMPAMIRFASVGDFWTGFFYGSSIKKIKAVFPSCTYSQALIGAVRTIEEVDLEFPIATQVTATCRYSDNYKKVRIIAPEAIYFGTNTMGSGRQFVDCEYYAPNATDLTSLCSEAFVLEEVKGEFGANATTLTSTFNSCYKLKKFPTNYPKASTAANMFNKCEIPGEAAIAVLNSLPTYTSDAADAHPITMGIHIDYENDPDVLAAIALADIAQTPVAEGGKGWAVTVQWNGTATTQTASTFGLRRRPVYAKLSTIELFDGTTETLLDWGHYVTNWEERGYQEFASLEEAEEYFNINQTEEV